MSSFLTRRMAYIASAALSLAVGLFLWFNLGHMREQWVRVNTFAHGSIPHPGVEEDVSLNLQIAGHDALNVDDTAHVLPSNANASPSTASSVDGTVVMGRLERENASWVIDELQDWQHAIYVVDNQSASLHTPLNKGREAMAYLTYIVTHYDDLPQTIVFLHSHRDGWPGGWHTDTPGYSNVYAVKHLNIDFIQRNGYANLRCNWDPGCPDEVRPFRNPFDETRNIENNMPGVWADLFGNHNVPKVIATPCCAQFAVSRDQIRKRPLGDYVHFRQWLFDTSMPDELSGRMFEYLWHIIFGQEPVYCPKLEQCYRDVYVRGGLIQLLLG